MIGRVTTRRRWAVAGALAVLISLPAGPAAALPDLDADRLARLGRYDVLSFADPGDNGFDRSHAVGVFDATPDEVFRTATDYERLAEFAPRLVSSRVMDRRGDRTFVMLASDLPWPVSKAWVYAEFQVERLGGDVYRIKFWQVRGSMRRYCGSMLIEPWAPQKTAVTYDLLVEPDTVALRGLVNRKLRDAAARYVHALRQRINDLHRLGRLHPQQPPTPDLPSALAGSRAPVVIENVARRGQ